MPTTSRPARLQEFKNFVNGEFTPTTEGRASDIIDPSTGEAYALAPVSGPADVDAALKCAEAAREGWRDATPAEPEPGAAKDSGRHRGPGSGDRGGRMPQQGQAGGPHHGRGTPAGRGRVAVLRWRRPHPAGQRGRRSEEHTSELQSLKH